MAANAPYYQIRQFTNGANAPFATADDDDYDLTTSLAPHNAALYVDSQAADNQLNTLEENHNLVELLEAATTAAGQTADAMNVDTPTTPKPATQSRGKRKRGSSPSDDTNGSAAAHNQGRGQSASKRARVDIPTDPQLNNAGNIDLRSPESVGVGPNNEALLGDARAPGVHSATALFRRPSEKTSRTTH